MLNIGAKVKVKSFAELFADKVVDECGAITVDDMEFVEEMQDYCGTEVTITESPYLPYPEAYGIEEDRGGFIWTESMFDTFN